MILKLEGKYLVWSSIVDAPITYGMTLDELREYWREEYGRSGKDDLERILPRVESHGFSSPRYSSFADVIEGNRAGENESELTLDEIVEKYVRNPPSEDADASRGGA